MFFTKNLKTCFFTNNFFKPFGQVAGRPSLLIRTDLPETAARRSGISGTKWVPKFAANWAAEKFIRYRATSGNRRRPHAATAAPRTWVRSLYYITLVVVGSMDTLVHV